MQKSLFSFAAICAATFLITACKKQVNEVQPSAVRQESGISDEVLTQIKRLGFGTGSVQKVEGGYLVEGDILLTKEHLNSKPKTELLRVGDEEQYRTSNTVLGLPRTITIRVSTLLPDSIRIATDSAIRRYNALGLLIYFSRVTTGGHIVINPAPAGSTFLASAGFPFDAGNPFHSIQVNAPSFKNWSIQSKATIMAHEIGHCIGFRHTDYMNRSFSCGGSPRTEGAGAEGAKWIPGTPVGPDPNSWMLSCIGFNVNRPFNANDKRALYWLY